VRDGRSSSSTSRCRATSIRRSRGLSKLQLFDLDDLSLIVAETVATRRTALERARAIVEDEATRDEAWRRARAAAPAIAALSSDAEQTRLSVIARHATGLSRLDPDQRALVETITSQLVAKLLHAPTLRLRRDALDRP
jgi:glutamyl-tRNA reductase